MYQHMLASFCLYTAATVLIDQIFSRICQSYKDMVKNQQWRITFRIVRCFAGLQVNVSNEYMDLDPNRIMSQLQ